MDRSKAIDWMEQWADRHGVKLEPMRRCRPGEHRVGLVRRVADGEMIPLEAMRELVALGMGQLTFEEWGPAPGSPAGDRAGGGGVEGSPPVSITGDRVTGPVFKGFEVGSESLFCGVDQVSVTGHGEKQREACLKMLQRYLGEGQPGLYGKNFYRETWLFDCGAMLCYTPGREDFSLVLRGRSMRHVGQDRHRAFIVDLWKHSSYATRLDVRVDDYSRELVRLDDFEAAYDAGNWAGARKAKRIDEKERVRGGTCRITGKGLSFGSRSGARMTVYDKELETQGEIPATRLETGYYDERAKVAFAQLAQAAMESEAAMVRVIGELTTGPVDFVQRDGKRHLDRMERLAFWRRIVDAVGHVRLRVEKAVSTLMGCAKAVTRQYVKKLARMAVIAEAAGRDFYHVLFTEIESARQGQELHQVAMSPREAGFDVLRAFKPVFD